MRIWQMDTSQPNWLQDLQEPARLLAAGGLVAFPTETVYGLGADACNETAVAGLFTAKGRPADNPLIVHIASRMQLADVVANPAALPYAAIRLMDHFWPGPLTLILPAHPRIAQSVRPGMETVGVRMPAHPVALNLIRLAGCPIAAPSANSSGRPSPTNAEAVVVDLNGKIDGVVDGGSCAVGLESTVVAVRDSEGIVYRPGWITLEELAAAAMVPFRLDPHLEGHAAAPKSPGMKYRHYAPDAAVSVWWGDDFERIVRALNAYLAARPDALPTFIAPVGFPDLPGVVRRWSPPVAAVPGNGEGADELYVAALSRALYQLFRQADALASTDILVVGVSPQGKGLALMNRLEKASEGRLFRV